jgi:DNA repair photolyase
MSKRPPQPLRGRGARSNPDNRFEAHSRELSDDGWGNLERIPNAAPTTLTRDTSRSILVYNRSPDVPFDRSVNPYRGCEHGCVYCFARPTHAYLGHSAGLDFETQLYYKPDAARLLRAELAKPSYACEPIALGVNTDAYQPVERRFKITRGILETLDEYQHPLSLITKSSLVERDIDILTDLARRSLVHVAVSITTLRRELARTLEPRAVAPQRRLETIARLSEAGIPVSVLIAPLIPVLTDSEMESIMAQARAAGAHDAAYILLRLPHEVKDLFREWLDEHCPLQARHVMSRIRDSRGGKDYDASFGTRMRGSGVFAELLNQRFALAYAREGFSRLPALDTRRFRPPNDDTAQLALF